MKIEAGENGEELIGSLLMIDGVIAVVVDMIDEDDEEERGQTQVNADVSPVVICGGEFGAESV